jgi:hypothetical protein
MRGVWVTYDRSDPRALRREAVVTWSGPLAALMKKTFGLSAVAQ